MKHLKLLVLLLAVLTTVFSYGQGTVAIRINEGQSMTTIAAHVDASNPFGSNFMTGSGFVVGMARGTDSIHASTPAGSSFGLFDPTDPNGPAITTVQGGDGTLTIDMPHEVNVAVDSTNSFFLGVIFMGFSGTYSETVTLSAGGTVVEVTFTAYNADDSTQTVTPTLSLTDVHTEMPCEMTGGLMMGSGYVIGMAQGIDTIHFQFPATSNFSLIDPNTAMGAPLANSVGEGGDGSMPNFLKNLDIDMATSSSAPYFYCPVVYYGPAGDFNETLSITAQGLEDAISVAFHAYPAQEDTTQMGGDPFMYASTTQLVLTGANPATWRLASGTLTINAGNIDALQLQMQSGRNIQIGDNSSFATAKTFYLNYAEQTTIDVLMLLNTVSPGVYTDVLTISAPGTNLQPIQVYISALVEEQQGGDSTQQTLSVGWEGSIDMNVEVGTWHDISIPVTYTNMNQQLVISARYPFSIKDPMDAAGATYSSYVSYPSQTYGSSGTVYPDFRINADQVGTYSGTLYFYLDEGVVDYTLTFTVNVYSQGGDSTHVNPGYFQPYENSLFLSCRLTSLQDSTFHLSAPAQFTTYNLDSLVVELASGAQYTLGNESTGQMGPRMVYTYQPYSKISDMVKVIFTGVGVTEAGYYMDTLIYRPYDGNGAMQPIYVPLTTEVIDNTQPRVEIRGSFSVNKDVADPWTHGINSVIASVYNIDSIRVSLVNGTDFKLFDILGLDSIPTMLDSTRLKTSMVIDSRYLPIFQDWASYENEWQFLFILLANVAGSYVDTMLIEPFGLDVVIPVEIMGSVTDWSGGNVSWQSGNVTVTLLGDSLIFSGSGSTLDYSDYGSNIAPWREDISTHFSYDEQPKHVIVEPGVSRLGNYSLYGFEFRTIDFGQLDTLGSYLFTCCNHIDVLELPASLDFIDCDALSGVYPKRIINNLRPDVVLCNNPFANMYPSSVVANTTMLLEVTSPSTCLVVPANDTIKSIYMAFGYAYEEPLDNYDYVVDRPMAYDGETVPAVQNPSVILYSNMFDTTMCGHLDVSVMATLHMRKFAMKSFYGAASPFSAFQEGIQWGYTPSFSVGYTGVFPTLVNDGMLSADTVTMLTKLYCNDKWHFTGMPFNQKVSDIQAGEHQYYCIRRFDGAQQAAAEYDSVWTDVEATDTLRAGEGFIIQAYTTQGWTADMVFSALDDNAKQNIFTPSVQSLPLQQHPAELAWNANWNFVVNPYPCFYDTRAIGGNGIITVYETGRGDYYRSYSIADDYYVLYPYEGFLYQAAPGEAALRMPLEGRQHSTCAEGVSYQGYVDNGEYWAPERATRTMLNFYLEQNNNKDRARVVLNETASMDYEVGVDATKMFAPGSTAAQLYAQQGGAKQSILERPTGNGIVYLGVKLMESGDCTISLPETRGLNVNLYDTETNVMTNLSLTDYTFFGTPGENSQRFIIGLVGDATALENFISGLSKDGVKKVIENGHVYILRGSDKFDVLGNKH